MFALSFVLLMILVTLFQGMSPYILLMVLPLSVIFLITNLFFIIKYKFNFKKGWQNYLVIIFTSFIICQIIKVIFGLGPTTIGNPTFIE